MQSAPTGAFFIDQIIELIISLFCASLPVTVFIIWRNKENGKNKRVKRKFSTDPHQSEHVRPYFSYLNQSVAKLALLIP